MYYPHKPYIHKKLKILREGRAEATPHLYTMERIRHPKTREHLTVCLLETNTGFIGREKEDMVDLDSIIQQAAKDIDAHILVAPEYSYDVGNRNTLRYAIMTAEEKERYVKRMLRVAPDKLLIPGTFVWKREGFLYNSAFLLYGGEIIGEYGKMVDGGEIVKAYNSRLTWQRGKHLGLFTWEKLHLGIEICADTGILAMKEIIDRDILFLIACGVQNPGLKCLRTGGVGFVNDGYLPVVSAHCITP